MSVQGKKETGTEAVRYLVAGIVSMLVGWGTYALCKPFLDVSSFWPMTVAVVLRFLAAATCAYAMDRKWVFHSLDERVLREYASFLAARCATLLVDLAIMNGANAFGIDDWIATFASQGVVTVLNYVIGKFLVFRSGK